MRSLRSQLPPPNALVAFEAAARHLNFTAAASELGVTQAAVSRQIRILEAYLGVELFDRSPKGVFLTDEGRSFYEAVSMALRHIAAKSTETRHLADPKYVTVSSTSGIAAYWLMPRIARFRSIAPEINLRLVTSEPPIMPGVEGIDLTIRYGDGAWPSVVPLRLIES